MTRSRILLVDDHELFREGLSSLLDAQPDLEVIGQAGDGLEALKMTRDRSPDLILMDIKMPVCDGLEATRSIRAEFPQAHIVMLTVHDEEEKLFDAIKAGASGYILKSTKSDDFLGGVRGALSGEAPLPPTLAARLLEEFGRISQKISHESKRVDEPDLTQREKEVLDQIAIGATDKEIAHRLSISVHTAKSHVRNILSKLHAVNRRHAAKLAAQQGLVDK